MSGYKPFQKPKEFPTLSRVYTPGESRNSRKMPELDFTTNFTDGAYSKGPEGGSHASRVAGEAVAAPWVADPSQYRIAECRKFWDHSDTIRTILSSAFLPYAINATNVVDYTLVTEPTLKDSKGNPVYAAAAKHMDGLSIMPQGTNTDDYAPFNDYTVDTLLEMGFDDLQAGRQIFGDSDGHMGNNFIHNDKFVSLDVDFYGRDLTDRLSLAELESNGLYEPVAAPKGLTVIPTGTPMPRTFEDWVKPENRKEMEAWIEKNNVTVLYSGGPDKLPNRMWAQVVHEDKPLTDDGKEQWPHRSTMMLIAGGNKPVVSDSYMCKIRHDEDGHVIFTDEKLEQPARLNEFATDSRAMRKAWMARISSILILDKATMSKISSARLRELHTSPVAETYINTLYDNMHDNLKRLMSNSEAFRLDVTASVDEYRTYLTNRIDQVNESLYGDSGFEYLRVDKYRILAKFDDLVDKIEEISSIKSASMLAFKGESASFSRSPAMDPDSYASTAMTFFGSDTDSRASSPASDSKTSTGTEETKADDGSCPAVA